VYKIFTIIFFVFYLPITVFSQTLTLKAIASGGDFAEYDNFTISYTIGECAIQTSPQIGLIQFTEGFQQGEIIIPVDTLPIVSVYPNPVTDKTDGILYVNLPYKDGISGYYISIYSLQGKIIMSRNSDTSVSCQRERLNFSVLPRGLFFVKVQSSDGTVSRTFKIENK